MMALRGDSTINGRIEDFLSSLVVNSAAIGGAYPDGTKAPHMVGAPGFEPGTSRLSGVCSNQLSYAPISC
jgi:hypothetical protein